MSRSYYSCTHSENICIVMFSCCLCAESIVAKCSSYSFNFIGGYGFLESMVSSLGCGLGFLLAMVLFAGVRSRLDSANIPESFKGLPVTLAAASIVSMSFMGFAGVVDKLFA